MLTPRLAPDQSGKMTNSVDSKNILRASKQLNRSADKRSKHSRFDMADTLNNSSMEQINIITP